MAATYSARCSTGTETSSMTGIGLWSPRTLIRRPRPGLAHRPDVLLLRRVEHDERIGHRAHAAHGEMRHQSVGLALELGLTFAVELDDEDGRRVTLDEGDLAGVARLRAGEVDEHAPHQLDRGRIGLQDGRRGGHRGDEVVELEEDETGLRRPRHQVERHLQQRAPGCPSEETSSRAGLNSSSGLRNSSRE